MKRYKSVLRESKFSDKTTAEVYEIFLKNKAGALRKEAIAELMSRATKKNKNRSPRTVTDMIAILDLEEPTARFRAEYGREMRK